MEATKQMLLALAGARGVSGDEHPAAQVAVELLAPCGPVETGRLGNVVCRVSEARAGRPHYLLDAHLDEIGLIVTRVDDSGFLKVSNVGGLDRRLLAASQVAVHAPGGALVGVICATPPHLQGDGDKTPPKIEELYVDIGMSGERARALVPLGCRVTFAGNHRALLDGSVCGRALDNRAGCAAVIRAARLIAEHKPDCGVTVALTAQEETGAAGAKTAAFAVAPTHCIVVDVSFAAAPGVPRHKCGEMGKGPMVGFAPILSGRMSERLVELAQREGIPCQVEVMGGATGTNADGIAVSGAGVATAILSVPIRSMHTPVERVCVEDIESTARLIAAYLHAEEATA
ncbi:M20/M25/M40 family metallo-hydrolase [Clostridiaceae bacterium NSJ-31]|uniref:M20/M25/M40 family metallo-hydrolase n=1 Tax=Ligaoa zhengdingensis TaxID=2763658 RepID=A0A926E255_9FIRM|nr:M20/M25/M40 family metallo-hydrolase [Ligaoa zhengdingensis]MBC8547410.1 M20/M25/M40 family metallo-hydrolase [Ligaoa zhengdingensis]